MNFVVHGCAELYSVMSWVSGIGLLCLRLFCLDVNFSVVIMIIVFYDRSIILKLGYKYVVDNIITVESARSEGLRIL